MPSQKVQKWLVLVAQNHQYAYQLSCSIRTWERLTEEKTEPVMLSRCSVSTSMNWMGSSYQSNRTFWEPKGRGCWNSNTKKRRTKGENWVTDPGLGSSAVRLSGRWMDGTKGQIKGWLYVGAAGNPLIPLRAASGNTALPRAQRDVCSSTQRSWMLHFGRCFACLICYLLSLAIRRWVSLLFKHQSFPSQAAMSLETK